MKKVALSILAILVIVGGSSLFAQSSRDIDITVNLAAWYDLQIGSTTVTFNDVAPAYTNPPGNVSIDATENPVTVRAFAIILPAQALQLTVRANGNLTKAGGSIGIGAISWSVGGAGYQAGIMATSDVTAGSWSGTIFHWHEGTFSYSFLRDYVNQEPGAYTATATYTLSVP